MPIGGFSNPMNIPDTELSKESTNTVQNKAIANKFEEVEEQIKMTVRPLPSVTVYTKPTTIDIVSGMQFVIYASGETDLKIYIGNDIYETQLANSSDTRWFMWVETGNIGDGSFIFPNGTRYYLEDANYPKNIRLEYDQTLSGFVVITIE